MSKKNQNRSISDVFKEIFKNLDSLKHSKDEKDQNSLIELDNDIKELKQFFKGIRKLILILFSLLVISIILFVYTIYQNEKLRFLNSDLESKKIDSIIRTIMDIKEIETDSSTIQTTYNYRTRNNEIITYNELAGENDSLKSNVDSITNLKRELNSKISTLEQKLNMAKENYGISFREFYRVENKDTINYIQITGKKVDSAFLLLSRYRDKLFYDKENDSWYIKDDK
jgi:hypothetical protein